ncbi:5-aminolevulinate synthase, mitochondrial [Hondaea fermentalgiana]|uniref:5-aminolevulinate synthase, mitochondrial n=1 Tax=Hondaea fermentalgiana TaxID=2315210 RepID=A0A2R5GRW2_9STRA|nr:5-aminolevulinate synthase, mitochondrial [Hondaea fermentalgiana]|eukprot:GBG32498.1 5-aminolevulinate synthase, mitochondrial [Hondaea fermentalgiana]
MLRGGAPGGLLAALEAPLERRRGEGLLRKLTGPDATEKVGLVDFSSNDYLSLAASETLAKEADAEYARARETWTGTRVGSTGSRLLSGNSKYHEEAEAMLQTFYQGESALLFNSGYDLNLGLFACMPQKGDVVVFDELMHNSVREGLRLSRGASRPFKHNDCEDLRAVLEQLRGDAEVGNIIVSVESVYSMDGHCAPLENLCALCKEFDANLVVDEAHGVGVFGKGGRGLVSSLGLDEDILCKVCTFGKAPGVHGAALIGPSILREYMINYCRPLIYSTSLPAHSVAFIMAAHRVMEREAEERQAKLQVLIDAFQEGLAQETELSRAALVSPSAVQGILIPGNKAVIRASQALARDGFDVMPIRSPTVPRGEERLRVILHSHNTVDEVRGLLRSTLAALRASAPEEAMSA